MCGRGRSVLKGWRLRRDDSLRVWSRVLLLMVPVFVDRFRLLLSMLVSDCW